MKLAATSPHQHNQDFTSIPTALKRFLALSAVLTIAALMIALLCRQLDIGLPYSFAYFVPNDMAGDFSIFRPKFNTWGTPLFFTTKNGYFMYPAPLFHVFRFFILAFDHPMRCFLLFMLSTIAFLNTGLVFIFRKNNLSWANAILVTVAISTFSYPLLFVLQRWNIEVLIWLLSSIGIWTFVSGHCKTAAVAIGIAASLKLYPIILLGMFLPRRFYKEFALSIATMIAISVVALWGIGPTIGAAYAWNSAQLQAFSAYYAAKLNALGYDHSFFALVKLVTLPWRPDLTPWVRPYTLFAATTSVILYFWRMWRLPVSNQVLALSILSVTLAPVSFDYTLLNLYPALTVLIVLSLQAEQRLAPPIPHITTYMILFAIILTPQSYIIVQGIRYAAQLRALCLIAMLFLSLKTPLPEIFPRPVQTAVTTG